MRPIPKTMRDKIDFKESILGGKFEELHHAFIYAGKQINELWAFAPLTKLQHKEVDIDPYIKNKVKFLLLDKAKKDGLFTEIKMKYPRNDWEQEYIYLKNYVNSNR